MGDSLLRYIEMKVKRRHVVWGGVFAVALASFPATAQTWDTSGNSLLNGTYGFRNVAWQGQYDSTNNLKGTIAVYGNIEFRNGAYTLSGAQAFDSSGEVVRNYSGAGSYSLGANGYGILTSLIVPGDIVNVLVSPSNGVIVGSSRTNSTGYNDLFVAAPIPSLTNSPFTGTYSMIGFDDPTLSVADTRSYQLSLTAGSSSAQLSGYLASAGATLVNQIASGLKYTYRNGAEVVTFGPELTSANVDADLMSGTKYFYLSPDGNFIFGGSPTGWDFIVGVRQSPGNFNGLYYTAEMSQDDSPADAYDFANLDSGYGSVTAIAGGQLLVHQRILHVTPSSIGGYDDTYSDTVTGSGGTNGDSFNQYSFSPNGVFGIGFQGLGKGSRLGIEVLLQTPPPTSPGGAYVYPTGVVNAGSLSPFTAGWAPGEFVSIYGANLASMTITDAGLPTSLGGVQVLVNNLPAAIYFVSSGQIDAVMPITLDPGMTPVATIQIVNGASRSNIVYNYLVSVQPGVFNSISGLPSVQHADYSPVSASNPARIGETLLVYLTGLGSIDASGNTTNAITATMNGVAASVIYAGAQARVGGSYQLNFTVPNGIEPGNASLTVFGAGSNNSSVLVPVGAGGASKPN